MTSLSVEEQNATPRHVYWREALEKGLRSVGKLDQFDREMLDFMADGLHISAEQEQSVLHNTSEKR